MKKILPLLILLMTAGSLSGGTFHGQWIVRDASSNAVKFSSFTIQPISTYGTSTSNTITGDRKTFRTDSDGRVTVSNLFNGRSYRVQITGPNFTTTFTNSFDTNVTGLVNGADYISAPIRDAGLVAYSQTQADARFLRTNISHLVRPGDNITITTNGTGPSQYLTISSTASGGGSATNVNFYPGQSTTWRTLGGSNVVDVTGTLTNSTTGNAATATLATNAINATNLFGTLHLPMNLGESIQVTGSVADEVVTFNGEAGRVPLQIRWLDTAVGSGGIYSDEYNGNGIGLTNIPGASITGALTNNTTGTASYVNGTLTNNTSGNAATATLATNFSNGQSLMTALTNNEVRFTYWLGGGMSMLRTDGGVGALELGNNLKSNYLTWDAEGFSFEPHVYAQRRFAVTTNGSSTFGTNDSTYFAGDGTGISNVVAKYVGGTLTNLVSFSDADNLWTATTLGAALEEMNNSINAGVPNGSGAKVHWSQLLGVPAGFADNTDDGAGGGSPGGSSTYVQYNNAGSFAGEDAFAYTAASDTLTLSNLTLSGTMTVSGSLNLNTLNVTNSIWYGAATMTNAANAIAAGSITNTGATASRLALYDANKKLGSAAASGAVPIDADGTATTFAQINALASGNIVTNGSSPSLLTVTADGIATRTNLFTINGTIGLGTNWFYTGGAATWGITGVTGNSGSERRIAELEILSTGDITFTNPAAFYASDGLDTRTLTNGNLTTVAVVWKPGHYTNLIFSWSR